MKIQLEGVFAANSAVNPFDVLQIKKALNRLGYYQPYEKTGITGIPDAGVFTALKSFQKDRDLPQTGIAKPGDDTVLALEQEATKTPAGVYIWRTAQDDKVRAGHVELNRTIRNWSDDPDPGEDINCRCWAQAVPQSEIEDLPLEAVYPELLLLPSLRIGKVAIGSVVRVLQKILKIKTLSVKGKTTHHGGARVKQRNISEKEIRDSIESAKKSGKVLTKIGKYGTPQTVYEGSNNVVVVIETQGRNAGKIITVWRK